MSEPRRIVICHPDDLNLADVKAAAAKYDCTALGNKYVPRGSVFIVDPAALAMPTKITNFRTKPKETDHG